MAGIYIHIPFCTSKCHYCNFFSTVSLKNKQEVVEAVKQEIVQRKNYFGGEEVHTVYYGGGTPTILSGNDLESIHQTVLEHFPVEKYAEITMEANPDDLTIAKLKFLKQLGVNRLSIGTQAFDDELLQKLNRRHTAKQAVEAVRLAQSLGFDNLSIDLIYGIPGLSNKAWQTEIHKVLEMDINHISAYHLTVEPGTALDIMIRKKKYPPLNEAMGMEQFGILIDELTTADFEHYEISNFAKNSCYSIHNTNYWKQKKYLGIGPSAHSYNTVSRQWNVAGIQKYYRGILIHKPEVEEEYLSSNDRFNEYIMLSLRTIWGVKLKVIEKDFPNRKDFFIRKADEFIHRGLIQRKADRYTLTKKGKKLADGIAAEFFVI
jgi:oxygen-independent coproporphyrinogen-3 oxidase